VGYLNCCERDLFPQNGKPNPIKVVANRDKIRILSVATSSIYSIEVYFKINNVLTEVLPTV
jgi:hypothetical protein